MMSMIKVLSLVVMVKLVSTFTLIKSIEKIVERERRSVAETNCQVPPNIAELFSSLNAHTDGIQFLISVNASQPVGMLETELSINEEGISKLETTCPTDPNPNFPEGTALWQRSSCPWYYESQVLGSDYYPTALPQAKCKCQSCLYTGTNPSTTQCERIKTKLRVMKKTGCHDGFYTYESELKNISVGCTCAKPETYSA